MLSGSNDGQVRPLKTLSNWADDGQRWPDPVEQEQWHQWPGQGIEEVRLGCQRLCRAGWPGAIESSSTAKLTRRADGSIVPLCQAFIQSYFQWLSLSSNQFKWWLCVVYVLTCIRYRDDEHPISRIVFIFCLFVDFYFSFWIYNAAVLCCQVFLKGNIVLCFVCNIGGVVIVIHVDGCSARWNVPLIPEFDTFRML